MRGMGLAARIARTLAAIAAELGRAMHEQACWHRDAVECFREYRAEAVEHERRGNVGCLSNEEIERQH